MVAITPAAGFVVPLLAAILIGSITDVVCFYAVSLKAKLQFDDSLDTFPVHGVGGTIGTILTSIFATTEVNAAGRDGLLRGNFGQILIQLAASAYLIAGEGMDINKHGEESYNQEFGDRLTFPGE